MGAPSSATASEPFAIVGVSFKLPQHAVDEPSLWKVLEDGESLMTDWPDSRVTLDSFTDGASSGNPNTVCASRAPCIAWI